MLATGHKERVLNAVTVLVAACALLVGVVRLREAFFPPKPTSSVEPRLVDNWEKYATVGHRIGPRATPVTIVEFADFQCPFCQEAHGALRALRQRYREDLAVVFRHFPLPSHAFAVAAARASECAARDGVFQAFHDTLFAQADSIGKKAWTRFAADVGITDSAAFDECVTDTAWNAAIERDKDAGRELGVDGTPTFLINELLISGFPGEGGLADHVRAAINQRRKR